MLVMGIDPGTAITGYALVREDAGELVLITCGTITTAAPAASQPRGRAYRPTSCFIDTLHLLSPPTAEETLGTDEKDGEQEK